MGFGSIWKQKVRHRVNKLCIDSGDCSLLQLQERVPNNEVILQQTPAAQIIIGDFYL